MTIIRPRRVAEAPDQPGRIDRIEAGTLAEDLGLRPGDRILSVNGGQLDDALEFQFLADDERVTLIVERDGEWHEFEVERDPGEPWGITFSDPTFDGIHLCENTCPFCFIKQLPKGMRKSLYVMDDDYRYSMLYGNFVTLTNLTEDDWRRIEEQRIGPMNVSVHATNPELRVALVGNPKAARILDDLGRLDRAGIEYNTQVVLCPGINDGAELDRTIRDLISVGPYLRSIAVVPVGLSKYGLERQSKRMRLSRTCMRGLPNADRNLLEIRRHTLEEALETVEQIHRWQEIFRRERGRSFVYLGDEFYLMTGLPIPPSRLYDGFPQVEDGIGITRLFLDDARRIARRGVRHAVAGAGGTMVCGTLIADTMRQVASDVNRALGTRLRVVSAENTLFGPQINVSGLLTGEIVLDAVRNEPYRDPVFVSETMISRRTNTFLDDMQIEQLSRLLDRPVIAAENMSGVANELHAGVPVIV
jgi:putative radical SAM enzyme (TIGR03279 family)